MEDYNPDKSADNDPSDDEDEEKLASKSSKPSRISRAIIGNVSGEKSDTISVYSIEQATGALALLQKYPTGKGSNWVEIVGFD